MQLYNFSACSTSYSNTFQVEKELLVDVEFYVSSPMTSASPQEECMGACINDDVNVCLMANLDKQTKTCYLSSVDLLSVSASLQMVNSYYTLFVRDCQN